MKKILLTLLIIILFPIGVLAESTDTITIDFGKIKNELDISYSQIYGLEILEQNSIISKSSDGIYNPSGKKLVSVDNNGNISVPSNVTSSDNIEYNIKASDNLDGDIGLIELLKNKKKIVMKYDGKYEPKDTINYYFYDSNKFIDELPTYGYDEMRFFGILLLNVEDTETEMDFSSINNKKLITFLNDATFTISKNVTSDDNISFNLSTLKYKYYVPTNDTDIPADYHNISDIINHHKIQRFLFAPENNTTTGAKITNLEVDSLSDSVVFNHIPSFNNLNINSDVLFSIKDEYVKYKITIHNYDKEDYKIGLDNLNSKYFTYDLSSENKLLKANSDNIVYLTIKYNNEANPNDFVNGKINDNKSLKIVLTKSNIISNPKTGGIILSILAIILLTVSATLITKSKKIRNKLLLVLISFITILPISVFALKQITLNVTTNNTIVDTYNYSDYTVIRYKNISLSETAFQNIREDLENKCYGERNQENRYKIVFSAINDISANVYIKDFPTGGEENLILQTTVSIENDADTETSDSKVVVGECKYNQNVTLKNYYNYGRKLNNNTSDHKLLNRYIEDEVCPRFREILEMLDAECINSMIAENFEQNQDGTEE